MAIPVAGPRSLTGSTTETFPIELGTSAFGYVDVEAKREQALVANPIGRVSVVGPWVVETWIDSMETLFEDLYILERGKVDAHCLERRHGCGGKGSKEIDPLVSLRLLGRRSRDWCSPPIFLTMRASEKNLEVAARKLHNESMKENSLTS